MAEKHIKKYPNGATLIYYNQNINDATDVTMGFLCGSKKDGKKKGLAHALEHSLFSSLDNLNESELYQLFRSTGTVQNAMTSHDYIITTYNVPNEHFEKIFKINADMLAKKKFSDFRWNKERKAILQELYMSLDEDGVPSTIASKYGKGKDEILGSAKTLSEITAKDFTKYSDKYFITDNMIISIVSSLPYEKVKKYVEDNFIYRFPTNPKNKVNMDVKTYPHQDKYMTQDVPNANSFVIEFLFKGLDNVEKNDLYTRFENWYFNEFAGKLYQKLRIENQLVYSSLFTSIPAKKSNLKVFEITTSPNHVNKCVDVMCEILREAIYEGVSEEDFALFKKAMLAQRARKTNIKTYKSRKLFNDYIYGRKPFVRGFFNKLMDLKREDVNKYLAKTYGHSKLTVGFVGDLVKAQKLVDRSYPINVVSDEQLAKDLKEQGKLYSFEQILNRYKYYYQIQLSKYLQRVTSGIPFVVKDSDDYKKLPKISIEQEMKKIKEREQKEQQQEQKEKQEQQEEETLELK